MRTRGEHAGLERLFASSPSESTPILLELARLQAARRRPADLSAQFERDAFVAPSALDQRALHRLDGLALSAAAEFEALQLSPVAPLGACSAIAPTSQDRTLAAARGTEVVSDPTNVLALECARRLTRDPATDVRLCTVHQVLRAQPLPPKAGFSRHFRMLALAEAGPGRAEDGFEVDAIARHARVFDALLEACARAGHALGPRRARLFRAERRATMAVRVVARLRAALPSVEIVEERFDSAYYDGLRVLLDVRASSGQHFNVGDTGVFDWMAKLSSNRKQRFVASGFGLQLVPLCFPAAR